MMSEQSRLLLLVFAVVGMMASLCSASAAVTGYCANGSYKFCDWASWKPWGECSNGCGTGVRTRTMLICCPPNIKESNISKCVEDLCHFSMSKYQEDATCTSTKYCSQGRITCINLTEKTTYIGSKVFVRFSLKKKFICTCC